jgi:phage terminase large subunit
MNSSGTEIKLIPQQAEYLVSKKRFCLFIGGIGVGKTFIMLLKIIRFCQENKNSVALIVRKEFTDLRDSTIIDFKRYFGIEPNSSRDVNLENGSKIMFRHSGEINQSNLKNMTLDIVGVEQAEELPDETAFLFIRDRMRGKACEIVTEDGRKDYFQQICLIANANGHDWCWKLWVDHPPSDDFHLVTATTFDNEVNLPASFVADMRARAVSEPNHYRRMVMNSFDEDISDDVVMSAALVDEHILLETSPTRGNARVMGVDVARFGEDETTFIIVERKSAVAWHVVHIDSTKKKSLTETAGKIIELCRDFNIDRVIVDDDGIGGGVTDILGESRYEIIPYKAVKDYKNEYYGTRTTEAYFKVKEWFEKDWLFLCADSKLRDQLCARKFRYMGNGKRIVVSKDEMRKDGLKSPDRADALMMAIFYCDVMFKEDMVGVGGGGLQQYAL